MAATEPRQRHPAAGPQTEAANRLITVIRAGRQMPAVEPAQRGKAVAVDLNESAAEAARRARKIAQHHVRRGLLYHCSSRNDPYLYTPKIVGAAREVMPAEVKWEVPGAFSDWTRISATSKKGRQTEGHRGVFDRQPSKKRRAKRP